MASHHKLKIGVMGSASGPQIDIPHAREMARLLGQELARRGHILINGACPGLPNDAMLAAKANGGITIGVSPAFSEHQHLHEYKSLHDHTIIVYTGMGFMERDIINIRSSDAIIIIGGGVGTLNELTIAYDEGRPIGVITGTDGISDHVPHIIEELCQRKIAPNMVFDADPIKLIDKIEEVIEKFPVPIHEDGRVIDADKPEGRRIEHEGLSCPLDPTRNIKPGSRG